LRRGSYINGVLEGLEGFPLDTPDTRHSLLRHTP
jgi:hypothetical protein